MAQTAMDTSKLKPAEWAVLLFTAIYVVVFFAYFLLIGNYEFIWYVLTLVGLASLIAFTRKTAAFPPQILWALSIWGLVHMAGGGIRVGNGVLYNFIVWPVTANGELTLLKFDQLVHFYGFAVTAWLLWHILNVNFAELRGTSTIYVYPALASTGLGALNEMIEFSAVLLFPDTNVGGYFNTALDLVFNALGASVAMVVIFLVQRMKA
jgi:putative membrane protein